jgi:hypothetical protein
MTRRLSLAGKTEPLPCRSAIYKHCTAHRSAIRPPALSVPPAAHTIRPYTRSLILYEGPDRAARRVV